MDMIRILLLLFLSLGLAPAAPSLPLKGGENVLFIGNSLTGKLKDTLNTMAAANQLPAFNGHQIQLWNETLETHVKISPEATPEKFAEGENGHAEMKGYKVKAAYNSLWKKGQYDTPEFNDKGYITALEAIPRGTPEGKPWDFIIIQGYSDANNTANRITPGPDGKPNFEGPLMIYGSRLIEAAKAAGATPVLYMAWLLNPELGGGNQNPESYYNTQFDQLIASYQALARAHNIQVIPVGAVMRALSKERKPAEAATGWLIQDNVHGSASGKALLNYTMTAALYGRPAASLTHASNAERKGSDSRYAVGETQKKGNLLITPEIDMAIRQAVDDFLKDYGWQLSASNL